MVQPFAPFGLTIDHRYRITSLTPAAARKVGAYVGMRAGTNRKMPWAMTRRYLEALERCFDSGIAVGWYEPGVDGQPPGFGQVFPLPFKRGLMVTSFWLDQIPKDSLPPTLDRDAALVDNIEHLAAGLGEGQA